MSEKENNFKLPEDYFHTSSKSIFNKIKWQEEHKAFPSLLKYRNVEVFGLPENYFETSENKLEILAYTKIASIQKQNSFSLPGNYFEENKECLFSLLKRDAKIISMFSLKMWYTAAAVLLIAFGFWFYGIYFRVPEPQDCNTLACIEKTDLLKTKTLESLDNEDLYDMVDLQKLEQNLNTTSTNEDIEN